MTEPTLAYEETFDCVQCGYCLPACPTYVSMGTEAHSPRGRINLVKMAAEGKITYSDLEGPIDLCLGCRACEVVCPTNVQYGRILDSAKAVLQAEKKKTMPTHVKLFQDFMFKTSFPNAKILAVGNAGLAFYQKTGLQTLFQKTKLNHLLPEKLRVFEQAMPKVEGPIKRRNRKEKFVSTKEPAFQIGFFVGCIMDVMFSEINTLSIRLLEAAGCEVTVIKEQTCCGALQHHSGETDTTKRLAKQNIEAFEQHDFDYVVNSIGGCGAMLVEYDQLLENDPEWAERAKVFAEKNVDISVILSKFELPFTKEIHQKVTYQPSCHLSNVQRRVEEPLQLIQSIPGIDFVPLPEAHMCCGSAGTYNIEHYRASMDILDNKMEHVKEVEPEIIITTNPGCHLQMKVGVERIGKGKGTTVVHLVELLAEACDIHI